MSLDNKEERFWKQLKEYVSNCDINCINVISKGNDTLVEISGFKEGNVKILINQIGNSINFSYCEKDVKISNIGKTFNILVSICGIANDRSTNDAIFGD